MLWRLPFGAPPECIPLGTVVAATPASARLVAVARWPAARASLVVRAARAVPTGVLMHALAWDATAPR